MKKQLIKEAARMQKLAGIIEENLYVDDKGNLQNFTDLIVIFTPKYYKNEKDYEYFYCEKGLASGFDIKNGQKVKYIVGYSNFIDLPDDKRWIFKLSDPTVELDKLFPDLSLDPDNCGDADSEIIGYIYSKSKKDIETEYTEEELEEAFYEALKTQ